MLKTLSDKLSLSLINNHMIQADDLEVYSYGIHLTLMNLLTFSSIIGLGIMINELPLTIIFLLSFLGMRKYAGGYHAKAYYQCYCLSCGIYGVTLLATKTFTLDKKLILFLAGCAYFVLFKIGSINSEKNPKTEEEMVSRKKKLRVMITFHIILITVGLWKFSSLEHIWFLLTYNLVSVTLLILLGIYQKRRVSNEN